MSKCDLRSVLIFGFILVVAFFVGDIYGWGNGPKDFNESVI